MNSKKFLIAFVVVFVVMGVTNFLIHGVILSSTYMSEGVKEAFRPQRSDERKYVDNMGNRSYLEFLLFILLC